MCSTWFFSRINDLQEKLNLQQVQEKLPLRKLMQEILANRPFMTLCAVTFLWNFSLNIAGPFFNVYMVQELKFTAWMVGITAVATGVSGLLVLRHIGRLSDRFGPRRVQTWFMFVIPLLPLAWILVRNLWHVVILNTFGGVFWGAFNLATFNLLLAFIPKSQVPRYSAFFQILVTLSLALGAFVGSFMVTEWGFFAVFIASGIGRYAAAGLFAWLVRDPLPQKSEGVPVMLNE